MSALIPCTEWRVVNVSPTVRRITIAAAAVVILVGVFGAGYAILRPTTSDSDSRDDATTTLAVAAATPSSSSPSLIATDLETRVLFLPTLLPSDLKQCLQGRELGDSDRFCSESSEDRWLQVALRQSHEVQLSSGTPIPASSGAVWLPTQPDRLELAFPLAQFYILDLIGKSVTEDEMLEIMVSVPGVANREALIGEYDSRLDLEALSEDELANSLFDPTTEPRATNQGSQAVIYADGMTLLIVDGFLNRLLDFAYTMNRPELIEGMDRPVVVGFSTTTEVVEVAWEQRGWLWSLEGVTSREAMIDLAVDIISQVETLGR